MFQNEGERYTSIAYILASIECYHCSVIFNDGEVFNADDENYCGDAVSDDVTFLGRTCVLATVFCVWFKTDLSEAPTTECGYTEVCYYYFVYGTSSLDGCKQRIFT